MPPTEPAQSDFYCRHEIWPSVMFPQLFVWLQMCSNTAEDQIFLGSQSTESANCCVIVALIDSLLLFVSLANLLYRTGENRIVFNEGKLRRVKMLPICRAIMNIRLCQPSANTSTLCPAVSLFCQVFYRVNLLTSTTLSSRSGSSNSVVGK